MVTTVISLAEMRERVTRHSVEDLDFQTLFERACILQTKDQLDHESDTITVTDWQGLKTWFQKEIADEVFKKKLFSRSILSSIWHVSDLLTSYAKSEIKDVGITGYMNEYADRNDPQSLLLAANSAFLFFVFWPETRTNRSIQYRRYGITYGPSLYAHYSSITRKPLGSHMSEAFEPLGTIVRSRFSSF